MAKKRYESIIPLSREHHYALLLCLRIHRGLEKHSRRADWLNEEARKTVRFFESSLVSHFEAEETILFPAMHDMAEANLLIADLLKEHEELRTRIETINKIRGLEAAEELKAYADLLESHIRKEERQLFPLYEARVASAIDAQVGQQILKLIGTGMQPKDPELLK
jgi:hemerythrin-like domain-containing protein